MYGATIIFQYDPTGAGSDGVRHLALVYDHYVGLSFSAFLQDLWNVLTFQDASNLKIRDPYKHVISYLTGGFLGQPQLFFGVVAFVYGYFFTGSFLEIYRHVKWRRVNYLVLGFIALLFLIKNIEGVNTVRTWTGLWVLVYACLKYYGTKNNKYIFLMLLPPFIHFGFWVMVLPALTVLFFGNRPLLYSTVFVLSSFTTLINPGTFVEIVESTERGQAAVSGYFVEEQWTFEQRTEYAFSRGDRWWKHFSALGVQKWGLNVLVYTLLAAGVYPILMGWREKSLFSIGLLTLTLSNTTWFIFALSNRSWFVGCIFILASFVMTRTHPKTGPQIPRAAPGYYVYGMHLSLLLFLPYFAYNLSTLIDYVSIFMFVAPFLVWFDPDINMTIKYVLQVLLGLTPS